MATESSVVVGSGLNPLKRLVCQNQIDRERHLKGTNVVVLNPEDASAGGSGLVTPQAVSTVATKIPPTPLRYRRALSICNNSDSGVLYIGFDSSVTTGTGYPIPAGTSLPLQFNAEIEIFGIGDTTGLDIRVLEVS